MKRSSWQIPLGIALVVLSGLFYLLHYFIFRDPHHIFIYLLGDVAFVFVEVLLVTLIIHRVLEEREKRARLEKLSMVIGTFFSEVGTGLLTKLSELDPKKEQVQGNLVVEEKWGDQAFASVHEWLTRYDYEIEDGRANWEQLKGFLLGKRDFLLRLLENPTLLEHESFTELLRAVFHLTEELGARRTLEGLPSEDRRHLTGDAKRVYKELVGQWLDYMKYLKDNYPYLFSLALRTNPFDESASVVVREVV